MNDNESQEVIVPMGGSYKLTEFEMRELYKHLKQTMVHWPSAEQTQISKEQQAVESAVRKLKFALDVEWMGE